MRAHHPRRGCAPRKAAIASRAPISSRGSPAASRCSCRRTRNAGCREQARFVAERFPGRAWIAAELLCGPNDRARLARCATLAKAAGLPLVAAGDVHMHVRSRRPLQDVLTAIRLGVPVHEAGDALHPNAERHLRLRLRLAQIYPPGAARRDPAHRRALRFLSRQPALRISRRDRARRDIRRPPTCAS